jgi:16S rRNA (guanine1207-N2)-methyltransferase
MRSARLTLALDSGALTLPPTGPITVFGPRMGDDLSDLPQDRLTLVQGFRPDHDHFRALGYTVALAAPPGAAASLVCLPRQRDEGRAMVAEAVALTAPGGTIIIDGQKTDGIDTMYRDIRARVATSVPLSKAHGKIFAFVVGDGPDRTAFEDWRAHDHAVDGGFITRPGVFSADGPDRGSALLAAALPAKLPARVVDLGAGWGYLARAILARDGVQHLDLVDADATALDCARRNITDPRAAFHWADALTFRPEKAADAVVCNPPFHTARAADPALGVAFIRAAARMLHPGGTLWLVSNRHLPYPTVLAEAFREVEDIGTDTGFRLTRAARPNRARP